MGGRLASAAVRRQTPGLLRRRDYADQLVRGDDYDRLTGTSVIGWLGQGRVEVLLELLRLRFGRVSAATRARVEAGRPEQLAVWTKRILTARSLDEVFAG